MIVKVEVKVEVNKIGRITRYNVIDPPDEDLGILLKNFMSDGGFYQIEIKKLPAECMEVIEYDS